MSPKSSRSQVAECDSGQLWLTLGLAFRWGSGLGLERRLECEGEGEGDWEAPRRRHFPLPRRPPRPLQHQPHIGPFYGPYWMPLEDQKGCVSL